MTKDTSSPSINTSATKSPRVPSGKSEQASSKSDKPLSTSKTPIEKSGGDEKQRDLRHSLEGEGGGDSGKKWASSKGTKIQLTRKRCVTLSVSIVILMTHHSFNQVTQSKFSSS